MHVALHRVACPPALVAHGKEDRCTTHIPKERFWEFLSQMRPHLAFQKGVPVGFRIYEKTTEGVLPRLELRAGDLFTHFCGVKAFDASLAEATICCKAPEPMSNEGELWVERERKAIRVMAPMPNRVEPTANNPSGSGNVRLVD